MELGKVIRIVAIFIVVTAIATRIAAHLMFPDATLVGGTPIVIIMLLALCSIWRQTSKKGQNSNK